MDIVTLRAPVEYRSRLKNDHPKFCNSISTPFYKLYHFRASEMSFKVSTSKSICVDFNLL